MEQRPDIGGGWPGRWTGSRPPCPGGRRLAEARAGGCRTISSPFAGRPGGGCFHPLAQRPPLAGERAPDDDASSYLRVRYKRRIDAMRAAGLLVGGQAAPAGDTVEIRAGRGRARREAGERHHRAGHRPVRPRAYRLGQDSKAWELLPSSRLFLPDGSGE